MCAPSFRHGMLRRQPRPTCYPRQVIRSGLLALLVIGLSLAPVAARAELVFLKTGRSVSVSQVRVEGQRALLQLRNGGEIVCDAAVIDRIAPDEVPYPVAGTTLAGEAAGGIPFAGPFQDLIGSLAALHRVDVALVRAVVATESGYRVGARSRKGALGLMQLLPSTARQYAVANLFDPRANLEAGIRHLRALLDRYELPIALAAYNAGEGAVARYGGIPPFRETREYVARVLRLAGLDRRGNAESRSDPPTGSAGPRS
jgi:soluble lytic murein transglycosylase-like protein